MDAAVLLQGVAYVPTWAWDFSRQLAIPPGASSTRASTAWSF